jgi:hypothetical protein
MRRAKPNCEVISAADWYAANIELWYKDLEPYTFATRFIPLTVEQVWVLPAGVCLTAFG